MIYERDGLEILRTEMDSGSVCDSGEFGDFHCAHYVIDGTPVFRSPQECADLMPGDSIVFSDQNAYTIANRAPASSVFLSVLFKTFAAVSQSIQAAAKERSE